MCNYVSKTIFLACAKTWEGLYKIGGEKLEFKCEKCESLGDNMASDSTIFWLYNKEGKCIEEGK